jgi:hypothetical protein
MEREVSANDLFGRRTYDPSTVTVCSSRAFELLPRGVAVDDYERPERSVPTPPSFEFGALVELRIAITPENAFAATLVRLMDESTRPIWDIWRDLKRWALYRRRAEGVRIDDLREEGVLAGGLARLRQDGEDAHSVSIRSHNLEGAHAVDLDTAIDIGSPPWRIAESSFGKLVLGVAIPNDPGNSEPTSFDTVLLTSVSRLRLLEEAKSIDARYVAHFRPTLLSVLRRVTDSRGRPAGRRLGYSVARRAAHDVVSMLLPRSGRAWLAFFTALLSATAAFADWANLLGL